MKRMPSERHYTKAKANPPQSGRRAILPYNGPLTHENSSQLEQDVLAEIQRQRSEVILDFKHVQLLDSTALETLMQLHHTLQAQGKRLKIIRLQGLCADILAATRLTHALRIYDNLHAAITNSQ